MSIRRFFHDDLASGPRRIDLPPDEAKHARRVLRIERGDRVELFDGAGRIADGTVESATREVSIRVDAVREAARARPTIDVAVAMPKGDRAATLVEKLSELGADRLIPLSTKRSVVDPGKGKLERFDRIALEAAKQCGRPWLMTIDRPTTIERVIANAGDAVGLIGDPDGVQELPIVGSGGHAARVLVLIGPEGGWTAEERAAASEAGFTAWRFAENVLRIETAAMAAVAILRDRYGGAVE